MEQFLLFLGVLLSCLGYCLSHSDHSLVLMISFDGFRWDYLQKVHAAGKATPNFDSLIREGVSMKEGMKNAFTTITFPNHYSLATGMYEENHGVVGNEMFDPVYNETFRRTPQQEQESKWWNNGTETGGPEPIWITNQKGSEYTPFKKRSGVFFWPGSEAKIHGHSPFKYAQYDETVSYEKRIDTIISWFSTEEDPINLGLLYFEEPDKLGHEVGPDAPEIIDKIVELDGTLGYLINQLKIHHLYLKINLVITSDHGMAQTKATISLNDYVDPNLYTHYGETIVWQIVPHDGKELEVYDALKKVPNAKVYRKEDVPNRFHFKNNRRIMPIVLVADKGYMMCHNTTESTCYPMKGDHGYDNEDSDMHPFFIAHGPAFKKGFIAESFNNVDIYSLLCYILEVEPGPNDGELKNIEQILFKRDNSVITLITFLMTVGFAATISGICCVGVCRLHRYHRYKRYVKAVVAMKDVDHPVIESQTHLLASDEEEIP